MNQEMIKKLLKTSLQVMYDLVYDSNLKIIPINAIFIQKLYYLHVNTQKTSI